MRSRTPNLPRPLLETGGEYRLLSDTFHPAVGFVAGWICLVVGFSAPIAASAMAFGTYLHRLMPNISPVTAGVALVVSLSTLHAVRVTAGGRLQSAFTLTTVILICLFIVGSAWHLRGQRLAGFEWPSAAKLASPNFAVSVIFFYYAYTGWNAAVYLSGEVREPSRNRPDGGGPYASIALQGLLATVMLVTLSFDVLLLYVGVTLSASAALTVSAVFVRRRRYGAPRYRAWGHPITPLPFLSFVLWMIVRSVMQRPVIASREASVGHARLIRIHACNCQKRNKSFAISNCLQWV